MNATFLQYFLYVNVFVIGVLVAVAVRHAYAHFRPHPQEAPKPHPAPLGVHLSPEVREKLLHEAETKFEAQVEHSTGELQRELATTVEQLTAQLNKLGTSIITDEMNRYQKDLEELRKQAETNLTNAQAEVTTHQTDLKAKLTEQQTALEAKLNEDIAAEKDRLVAQIDTKLADAVTSFLDETLQHNVDLGAQSAYLISMLEEHKAELIGGIKDEA